MLCRVFECFLVFLATCHLSLATMFSAHIAQSVEHFLGKEEVSGSNPDMSSIFLDLQNEYSIRIFKMF